MGGLCAYTNKNLFDSKKGDIDYSTQFSTYDNIREDYNQRLDEELTAVENSEYFKTLTVEQQESERKKIRDENNAKYLDSIKQQTELWLSTAKDFGSAMNEIFADGEVSFKEFGKAFLLFSLDLLERQLELQIASATIQSLSQPDSVASFGITGLVRAAALTALMRVAFGAAKAWINGDFNKGDSTAKHASGGFAYEEQYVVSEGNKPEYIVPNWMVKHPKIAPVISSFEKMRETGTAVDITSLSRKNGLIPAVNMASVNSAMSSFSFGIGPRGYVVSPGQTIKSGEGTHVQQFADPELKMLLAENSNMLRRLSEMEFNISFVEFEKILKRRALREKLSKL